MTERSNWLRVLQRETKVEQCDLFISLRKSNELAASGEYEEVMQFEPLPVSRMLSDNTPSGHYEQIDCRITARKRFMSDHGSTSSSSSFYLNQVTRPININKRHTDRQLDSISKRKKAIQDVQ